MKLKKRLEGITLKYIAVYSTNVTGKVKTAFRGIIIIFNRGVTGRILKVEKEEHG